MTTSRGSGSLGHRGGDQWEIRVSWVRILVSGRSVVRSLTVRGDLAAAQQQRELLAAQARRCAYVRVRRVRTLADLLRVWLQAEHDWKPSTWQNDRIAAARLSRVRSRRGRQPG